MGNWQLEVFKFALYITMPIGAFYAYNQTEWFRDYLYYYERKSQTPQMRANAEKLNEFREELKKVRDEQDRALLEKQREAAVAKLQEFQAMKAHQKPEEK